MALGITLLYRGCGEYQRVMYITPGDGGGQKRYPSHVGFEFYGVRREGLELSLQPVNVVTD